MCYRKPQPFWQRLNFLAFCLLMMSTHLFHRNPWKSVVGVAGAVVLAAAITLMFVDRRRGGGSTI